MISVSVINLFISDNLF